MEVETFLVMVDNPHAFAVVIVTQLSTQLNTVPDSDIWCRRWNRRKITSVRLGFEGNKEVVLLPASWATEQFFMFPQRTILQCHN
jgi:hypothetical protein